MMKLESIILLLVMCFIMAGCAGYIPPVVFQLDVGNYVAGIRG